MKVMISTIENGISVVGWNVSQQRYSFLYLRRDMDSHRLIIMFMHKLRIEAEKDRKEARNRAYQLIKKNNGYFKDAAGKYVERICYCHVCERERVPVRVLEAHAAGCRICAACADDFNVCMTLLSMKKSE